VPCTNYHCKSDINAPRQAGAGPQEAGTHSFVMRGLDPRIHPSSQKFFEEDGLPGQARQ
jgi:hypothetical protein